MSEPVRVVHIDEQVFGDADRERGVFESAFGTVDMTTYDGGVAPTSVAEADIVVSMGSPVPAALMDATGCSVVAVYATGFDMVNVEAASERGVAVTRVPEYCNEEVGQHTVTLALAVQRGLPHYDSEVKSGGYDWKLANPLYTWNELTFGFLAFGRKARAAAKHADALGFDLLAHDPYMDDDDIRAANASPVSFDELLTESDILSVHTPLTPESEDLLNAEAFARMKEGAVLVNTSRGAVVDEDDLLDALEHGPLFGAGLDVTREEPLDSGNSLLDRDDVLLTPHVAWNSEGAIRRIRERGSEIAIAAYQGRNVAGIVNPEVFDGD